MVPKAAAGVLATKRELTGPRDGRWYKANNGKRFYFYKPSAVNDESDRPTIRSLLNNIGNCMPNTIHRATSLNESAGDAPSHWKRVLGQCLNPETANSNSGQTDTAASRYSVAGQTSQV